MTSDGYQTTTGSCPRSSDWDPLEPDVVTDPLGKLAELRGRCPVAHSDRWGGFWGLMRHDDILAAALDTDTFVSGQKTTIPDSTGPNRPPRPPLESDRPQHTQYRRLLAPYFSGQSVGQREHHVREIAGGLIDAAIAERECDLVSLVALPMPALVLCSFLGLPSEDWTFLKQCTTSVIDAARTGDAVRHAAANDRLYGYVHAVVEDRRVASRDPAGDLITGLIELRVDGEPLDDEQVTGVIRLLLQAGHNTTTNGIGSVYRYLGANPDEQTRLRNDLTLIPIAVEELLRAFTPAQLLARTLTRDLEIRGCRMHSGEKVGLFWASANRDPEAFDRPDEIDLAREPNRHVAFGYGIHRCIGAPLARLELRVAIEEMLKRTANFELIGDAPEIGWPHIGPRCLPVRIDPR